MSDVHLSLPSATIAHDPPRIDAVRTTVYAHGLTSSRASDDDAGIFDFTPVAGAETDLIRYDARGHGASTGTAEPDTYTWSALGDDLLALIDVISPDRPVDAIGASMGTASILWAVTRRPDRFRRLVLAVPPTAWATRAAQAATYENSVTLLENQGFDAFLAAGAQAPRTPILVAGGWSLEASPPAVATHLLPSVLRGAAASDLPDESTMSSIGHDTLLLPWATDPAHPVETAQRLAALLPTATLEVAEPPEAIRRWGARAAEFLAV